MMIPRVIPTLLLQGDCLYKTVRFRRPTYVGDAINAVRIFNEKEVDELVFLDIRATASDSGPRMDVLQDIAGECFMPLAYGGGIRTLEQAAAILKAGAEKIIICSALSTAPDVVREAAAEFGSQAVVAAIDYKRGWFGRPSVFSHSGTRRCGADPVEYARRTEDLGVGEILLTSIDHDGRQCGYDLDMIRAVSDAVDIPVIASGGAASLADLGSAIEIGASAVAAGSLFVFHGKHRAVLITYPDRAELEALFVNGETTSL